MLDILNIRSVSTPFTLTAIGSTVVTPTILLDIVSQRGRMTAGGNPLNFMELYGAAMVETTAFEPDARTYRGEYYYNVLHNRLYRRIVTTRRPDGVIKAQWVPCSD